MPEYVPTPTFSERKAARVPDRHRSRSREIFLDSDSQHDTLPKENGTNNLDISASMAEKKKTIKPMAPLPDAIRQHRLPLTMKSHGDSLQVYLNSYARTDEDGCLVYDVEFDDGAIKLGVPRTALHIPAATSYQVLQLQESQNSARTPTREERRKLHRDKTKYRDK